MTIHKAKSSNYNELSTDGIVGYIDDYATDIFNMVKNGMTKTDYDRTQLKAIAAELETVKKRLDYILHGRY